LLLDAVGGAPGEQLELGHGLFSSLGQLSQVFFCEPAGSDDLALPDERRAADLGQVVDDPLALLRPLQLSPRANRRAAAVRLLCDLLGHGLLVDPGLLGPAQDRRLRNAGPARGLVQADALKRREDALLLGVGVRSVRQKFTYTATSRRCATPGRAARTVRGRGPQGKLAPFASTQMCVELPTSVTRASYGYSSAPSRSGPPSSDLRAWRCLHSRAGAPSSRFTTSHTSPSRPAAGSSGVRVTLYTRFCNPPRPFWGPKTPSGPHAACRAAATCRVAARRRSRDPSWRDCSRWRLLPLTESVGR